MADVKLYLAEREERRQKNRRRFRIGVAGIVGVAILIGSFWLALRSPFVAVQEIRITGNVRIPRDEIEHALLGAFGGRSLIARMIGLHHVFAWPGHLVVERPDFLPELERIEITRRFFARRIDVSVTEREPAGIWCLRKKDPVQCFWFAKDGALYAPSPEAEGSLIYTISDYASEGVSAGSAALLEDEMRRVMEILNVLSVSGLRMREIRYEDPALQELRVATYDGPSLYFSLRFSPAYAAEAIRSLREDDAAGKLHPAFSALQYVDFRVENRVYYQ
ncbi:MAG: hypothetical protein RL681_385 [Candidatus Parcubacteria bacterium]|jgi:hypothetical protein